MLISLFYFFSKESSKVATRVAFLLQDSNKNDDDLMKKTMTFVLENFKPNSAYLLIKRLFKEKTFNDLKANKVTLSQLNFKVNFNKNCEIFYLLNLIKRLNV